MTAPLPGQRVVFIDLARCASIVLMVLAHVTDTLLRPGGWDTPAGRAYLLLRGITAPVFFSISGWSFTAATLPRWERYRQAGPELRRRLRRVATLFLWGYALTLPWWAEGFPFRAAEHVWLPFWGFGVLQCIGSALLMALLLVRFAPSPRWFAALASSLALVGVAVAPVVQSWSRGLPHPLGGALHAGFAGGFPLLPWTAFFFVGAAVGVWTRRWQHSPGRIALGGAAVGAVAFAVGAALDPWMREWLGQEFNAASPSLFLRRLGAAALLLSIAALVSMRIARLPGPLERASSHALTFYSGHMIILWGAPLVPGLVHRLAPTFELEGCAGIAALCLVAIGGAIELALWLRRRTRASQVVPG